MNSDKKMTRRQVVSGLGTALAATAVSTVLADSHAISEKMDETKKISDPRGLHPKPPFKSQPKPWQGLQREMEQQLLALAKRKDIRLPPAATGCIQPDLLLKNAGLSFGKMYVHAVVAGHASAGQEFENYAITGKDPDLRSFPHQILPVQKNPSGRMQCLGGIA